MDVTSPEFWQTALVAVLILIAVCVTIVVTLLITAWQQVQDLNIPQDADFFETLQVLPVTVPIALDLLDLAFDVFAAPISWVLLELMGLRALQMITVIEGVIPGTGVIPTMTIAWFVARGMKRKEGYESPFRNQLRGYQNATKGRYGSLGPGGGGRRDALSAAQRYRSQDLLNSGEPSTGGSDPLGGAPAPRTRIPSGGVVDGDIVDGEFLGEGEDDFNGDYSEEERF